MIRCLGESTLLLLQDGGGTDAQRTHLTECGTCARQYRQLEQDLAAISHTLRERPPPTCANDGVHPFIVRWATTAGALTLAFIITWWSMHGWGPSVPRTVDLTRNAEIWNPLQEFSADIFSLNEANAAELWFELASSSGLAAAPDEGWPADWYDLPARDEVEFSTE